jgi:hypothetical protein
MRGIQGITYRLGLARSKAAFALRGASHYGRLRARPVGPRRPIAAVMVGRNDDYMSDFRERLVAVLEWNIRYLVSEVVFVEWNPPKDRELLSLALAQQFPELRAYVVPAAIHEQICENAAINLLEYHAKNVGIRRASAPWILATNADAAVGLDAVSRILKTEPSADDLVYTAERFDIPWREGGQRRISLLGSLRYKRVIPYHPFGTGEFALASRRLWHEARGYDERMVRHRIGCDIRGTAQMVAHGGSLQKAGTVLHLTHPSSCTEGVRPHHGEHATVEGIPYRNPDDWGLSGRPEVELAPRVFEVGA